MNFSKQLGHHVGAVVLFMLSILAHGSVSDADLEKQYGEGVLTLREFYPGEHLHFDAAGRLSSAAIPGAWTLDGQVRVKDISLKDGVVHIRGQRLFLFLDPENQRLRDVGSVTKKDKARKFFRRKKVDEWAAKKARVEIEVECGVAQPQMADVTKAMNVVFLAPGEVLTEVMPDFWKNYLEPNMHNANEALRDQEPIAHVGNGVSPPHPTYQPDPSYSELARQAGYEAVSVLRLIVDRVGLPKNIRIAKPAGMGLDEQAVNAVRTWRFDPAQKDGNPVAVRIVVEVAFKVF
jgi:TonB family protein